ncbi:hypothetical protein D2E76_24895 [Mycobacteroides abscessus]|uniref:Uncharacterized protein n=1 Tax=Mycobacteroides abscessus TaxID=36809 RepID=A0ABD7HHJ0_9MYCO|nr:hypothetical protein D2E76_24895 [Mycobacteroides abscessus]
MDIADWWPQLHIEIRRVLVNGIWSPVSPYAQSEIARFGGPMPDSAYWKRSDGEVYLPSEAVVRLIESPDFKGLNAPKRARPASGVLSTQLGPPSAVSVCNALLNEKTTS